MKLRLKPRLPGKKTAIIMGVSVLLIGAGGGALHFFGPKGGIIHAGLVKVGLAAEHAAEASEDDKRAAADAADWKAEISEPEVALHSDIIHKVRTLQLELTAMSRGDPEASTRFKKVMIEMRTLLRGSSFEKLDPAEIDALVVYVLSGGTPDLVLKATAVTPMSTRRKALLQAALAYVSDSPKLAAEKLSVLDPAAFPDPIAARLNMMLAQVHNDAPFEERRGYLVEAANHALGTLVEEAATRRLVALASTKQQRLDFVYWASRYERRFPKSLYYSDFATDLVKGIAGMEKNKTPVADVDLELLAAALPLDRKVAVMGDLQATALRAGYKRLCSFAFGKIVKLAAEGSEDMNRARLYQAACNVGDGEAALQVLTNFKAASFSMEDVEVLRAATSLADGIAQQISNPVEPVYGPQQPYEDFDTVKKLNASVAQQLETTSKALEGLSP
ncbi:hypothetical protein [Aestuariivirga litoralis]|uniref:hypothetical protein n=1 Tax=Aestuariivirga litoralis TaxID=2650924 RepID=UPI0018C5FACB|nr:hypothetical protein [Aestuariivirga litoralis]MBG1233184.1 hypothetical protein [Aestuariivirga litoralis]